MKKYLAATTYGIGLLTVNVLMTLILLFLVEGFASYSLWFLNTIRAGPVAERQHTQYDPELGWVNRPDMYIPDMYGPAVYLRTNSQGFRNNHNFTPTVALGKRRIICSGDSFTLGYGVDNDNTWCELLTSLDTRLETVNMGQGGYGVDQAYLWFKRNAREIEHDMHILAFVTADFWRMQSDRFHGYGKPVIAVKDGILVIENVPVPRFAYNFMRVTTILNKIEHLQTVEFANRALTRVGFLSGQSLKESEAKDRATREVLIKIFEELRELNEQGSSKLLLVYLPTVRELREKLPEEWINFVMRVSHRLNIPFINMFEEVRLGSPNDASLFRDDGHLSNKGNDFVARAIYASLKKHLSLSPRSVTRNSADR